MNNNIQIPFGGDIRTPLNHAHIDMIPNDTSVAQCPNFKCQMVTFYADPDNSGDCVLGTERLSITGAGIKLEAGKWSPWFPVANLNEFYHQDAADSNLVYVVLY